MGVGGGVFYGGLSHARVCVEVECYLGCSMLVFVLNIYVMVST